MNEFKIGTKFNDVLAKDIIESWKGQNIVLDGATGSGKTYFVENNLYTYAQSHLKSILFLCNRTALYEDILQEKEMNGLRGLNVMLYQTIESKLKNHETIEHFDFIVADEFHYILTDALFNVYTDLTYDWIISQTNSCKIFMSGTGGAIFNKLIDDEVINQNYIYRIPYDYSYANIKFFEDKAKVFDIINDIMENTDEKIIYFANSTDFAIEVYKQFKDDAVFRCSKQCKDEEARELNDTECIKTYSKDLITFEKRLLITTKALDNGINIKDKQLKHIICDVFDLESAQQCLGRKRIIDNEDKCTFYIRNYNKQSIGNFKGGLHKNLNPVQLFIDDREEFDNTYGQDRKYHNNFIYFDGDKRQYNKLAYYKMKCLDEQIELAGELSYKMVFLTSIKAEIEFEDLDELEEYKIKDEIELYLNDLKEQRIYVKSEEHKELIDELNITDKKKRQQSSIRQLNTYIQENYNKSIVANPDNNRKLEDGSINPNRGRIYWTIIDGIIK